MSVEEDFLKYPSGKIPKGSFCDVCKRFNAREIVCDVLAVKDNKLLMIKRAKEPLKDYWALPGGYISWDETTAECAKRELYEETGYKADVKFFKVKSSPKRCRQNVAIVYTATVKDRTLEFDKEKEVQEVKWYDFNKLPTKVAFDHSEVINEYLESIK